ncbi:MAG: hypothetical protein RI910_2760 [Verrucomicrobiota bacterium]
MPLQNATECRDELLAYFRKHLVGPAEGANEIIPLTRRFKPSNEYLTGTLYPQLPDDLPPDPTEVRETGHAERYDGAGEDSGESAAREASNKIRKQSSCGITFTVPAAAVVFKVKGDFGRYLPGAPSADGRDCAWTRQPVAFEFDVPCASTGNESYSHDRGRYSYDHGHAGE